ncbi:MAG: hypothetical protein QOD84_1505 [Acidobacteriaceae bacterium]|jgi:tetratricopeptide (TPR) repeat protein
MTHDLSRRFLFSLIFITCAVPSHGQKTVPAPAPVPKSLETSAEKAPDYSQEAYVLEKWYTTYRFENDGTGKRELYARIRVQSEAGVEQLGQVMIGYNSANERVEIPYVRVLKADGTIVTAPPDSVQDLSAPLQKEAPIYTDFRQKHITVPGLRPGEVLEYDIVTVVHTALAPGQFWMEHDFAKTGIALDEKLEVNIPKERSIKLKTRPGSDPKISEEGGRKIYRWTSSHREPDDDDSDKNKTAKKARKKNEPDMPAVQITTFADWAQMGKWYGELEHDRRNPSAEIRAKAAELTAGKNTDLEKIEALYDFVAKNFRYISLSFGVGRFQPHAASDVLHNQYGDCKDKHTLLASLLEASGYHASSVLINSSRKLDPDMPSPSQFDHVISLVPLGKEEVWMDTTTEVAPFRLLSLNIRKKQGLVIPAEGVAHLEETPADPPFPSMQVQEFAGKVTEFGKVDGHVNYQVRGDLELFLRILFRRLPNSKWQQFVSQISASGGLNGDLKNLHVSDPAATREPFHFDWDISAQNFVDWAKKKSDLTLPLSEITLPDADEDSASTDPIQLNGPGTFEYHVKLEFPAKYALRAPLAFSLKRDYGQYDATYKVEKNTFVAERKLVTGVRELPQARASDYLAFRRAVFTDTRQHLSIDSTAAGTPTAPTDLKGDDLKDAANAEFQRGNFSVAIDLLKRVVEADPKDKASWNSLGRSYMALRQTDNAIAAFRKQTEVSEYDENAFASLGWALSVARRYDEAAVAYNKAIEISPLSEYAHGALGQMYSEAHQYEKAVPELEKAVSIKSDNPAPQVALGDAYLNLGKDDKALAAFDQAVQISATPEVWNNVAYQLSLKQSHLDRAQQYAESAVSATAGALRNASLDQLNQRDLAYMNALYAYWDTLGWVNFAKGDFDKAQKYVGAAWTLSQSADVGDHLGQIYEKLGRKDDAIQAYAKALDGVRPEPETRGRLAKILGSDKKVDPTAGKFRDELAAERTIQLGKVAKETSSAEFFVMLIANKSGATVEGVKFVSGDDKLKVFSEALKSAKYNVTFPDETPTKILRRGLLSCSKLTGNCLFVMYLPEDVRSVD